MQDEPAGPDRRGRPRGRKSRGNGWTPVRVPGSDQGSPGGASPRAAALDWAGRTPHPRARRGTQRLPPDQRRLTAWGHHL